MGQSADSHVPVKDARARCPTTPFRESSVMGTIDESTKRRVDRFARLRKSEIACATAAKHTLT